MFQLQNYDAEQITTQLNMNSSNIFCIALLQQAFINFDFISLGNAVPALIDGNYE